MNNPDNENDIVPEVDPDNTRVTDTDADESVIAEESAQATIKGLREKLKLAQEETMTHLTDLPRAKADFINARKRDEESQRELSKYANERLVEELVPVLESFDMAMGNKEAWEKADKNWRIGVEYIAQQLHKVLEDNGLSITDPIGQAFDITKHEAVGYEPVKNPSDSGKVIKVVQKGYMLNGKVMKAPKVTVGEDTK
jgi:molecular chaperone GrpE